VVDQPATIGALPVAVARASGHQVAYLPGLAMRRIADLYPGHAKTDARDAFIIADAARTLPHTLRPVDVGDDALAELDVLVGFDNDLAEATRLANRISGLLTSVHPALERAIGPRISHLAVLDILSRCGGPTGIRTADRGTLLAITSKHAPRMGEKLIDAILTARDEQTVTVPATTAPDTVLPRLADSLKTVLAQRKQLTAEAEEILDTHPLAGVLTSMPGIAIRTAARILLEIGDASAFQPPATWPPTPPSPAAPAPPSKVNTPPAPATASSNAHSSSPRSQPCPTPPAGPTTTENAPRARNDLPGPTPPRRPVRHAPQQNLLPASRTRSHRSSGLTTT
jgi:transposase